VRPREGLPLAGGGEQGVHRATLVSGGSRRALPAPRVGGRERKRDLIRSRRGGTFLALEGAADVNPRRVARVYIITNGIPDFRGIPAPVITHMREEAALREPEKPRADSCWSRAGKVERDYFGARTANLDLRDFARAASSVTSNYL